MSGNEGIKAQKKGLVKPDKRVLQLAGNIIAPKNIRVRPKFWRTPKHPLYNNFIIYTNWKHWKKDYPWLYLPEQFTKIRTEILKELLEKKIGGDGKEEFKWKRQSYFVSRNRNNQLTVNFQNLRQLDFLKPTTVLFFGGKEWTAADTKPDDAEPWKKLPRLYFFSQQDYADNDKLLVECKAELDKIWAYTGNYYNSPGYGEITKAFIGHEHQGHTIGPNWANDPNLKEGNSNFGTAMSECAACDDCFDFCNDLRVKRAVLGGFGRTMTSQWNPGYGIVYSAPNVIKGATGYSAPTAKIGDTLLRIPTNLQIKQWGGNEISEKWFTSGLPCTLYLVDKKHHDQCSSKPAVFYPDYDQDFYHELPREYNEVPHLMSHSTGQFYFQKKLLFTANIRHLSIGRKITPNSGGKPIFVMNYRINTASSVSGILYKFQSGEIYFRWELDTKGSLANQSILSSLAQAFTGRLMKQVGEWAGAAVKSAIGAAANFFGVGSLWKKFSGESKDKNKKGGGGSIKDILTPEKYQSQSGVKERGGRNQDKKTEQHTERKGKSTQKGKEWVIAPSLYATETIDFNYDFWELVNRSELVPFMPRFEHSEVFYNNLHNNYNLFSAPIRSLATPFSSFKQLITPGFIQGDISLDEDDDGFFAGLIRRGTPFIGEKKEFFKPFKYRYKGLSSYTPKSVGSFQLEQGEEDIEEVHSTTEEELGKFDGNKAIAGYTTYFRVPDDNLYESMAVGKFSSHCTGSGKPGQGGGNTKFSDGKNMVCWGCGLDRSQAHEINIKAGGEIFTYFDSSDLGEGQILVPNDCTLIVDSPNGNIRAKVSTVDLIYHYRGERVEIERDEEIAEQEYQENQADPTNTSAEVEIDIDDDEDKEEVDLDDLDADADSKDEEQEDDWDEEQEDDWDEDDDDDQEEESDWEDDEEQDDDEESDVEDDDDEEDDSEEEGDDDTGDQDNEDEDTDPA